jgi:hypothetical protein
MQYKVSKILMLTRTEERNPHNPSQTLVRIIIVKINFYIKFLVKMFSLFS